MRTSAPQTRPCKGREDVYHCSITFALAQSVSPINYWGYRSRSKPPARGLGQTLHISAWICFFSKESRRPHKTGNGRQEVYQRLSCLSVAALQRPREGKLVTDGVKQTPDPTPSCPVASHDSHCLNERPGGRPFPEPSLREAKAGCQSTRRNRDHSQPGMLSGDRRGEIMCCDY